MANGREDRRTLYSKRIIRESLYELMKEKPLNKITVTEICERADVNRSTFYAYYQDIYDLHQKIIKEFFVMQKTIIKHIHEALLQKNDIREINLEDYYDIAFYYLKTVKDNIELYKFVFNQNSTNAIHTSFGKVLYHTIRDVLKPTIEERRLKDFRQAFTFVSGGTVALIMKWIQNNCDIPTEELAEHIAGYYYGCFKTQILK